LRLEFFLDGFVKPFEVLRSREVPLGSFGGGNADEPFFGVVQLKVGLCFSRDNNLHVSLLRGTSSDVLNAPHLGFEHTLPTVPHKTPPGEPGLSYKQNGLMDKVNLSVTA
jgi:hypothetical protein